MKEFVDFEMVVIKDQELDEILAYANSGPCVHAGACTGGPASPCSTTDAWH